MMNLFLASSFSRTISKFIELNSIVSPQQLKIAFIENAADPYRSTSDLEWIKQDKQAFDNQGFSDVDIVDLNTFTAQSANDVMDGLGQYDVIHFCGGHTRYLLRLLHISGFFAPLQQLVRSGSLIYTGTSAGSMVVCPSLFQAGTLDDTPDEYFSEEENRGLDLVDFLILPHFNNPEFIPDNYQTIQSTSYPHPLLFLNDNQAIHVQDSWLQIVDVS